MSDGAALIDRLRPITVSVRLPETGALALDIGKGRAYLPLIPDHDNILATPQAFSGDKRLRFLG